MVHRFKPSERGNCLKGMLIGCSVLVLIIVMVMIGTYFYFKKHGAEIFSGLMTGVIDQVLAESTLSEEEQEAIKNQVARITDKLKEGEITNEHMRRFTDAFGEGDILYLVLFEYIEDIWVPQSGLSPEEKDLATLEIQRTKRGIAEGIFSHEQMVYIEKALPTQENAPAREELIENPTDEQVSDLIGDLKIVNDEAGVPEGEYEVDYANYVRDLVDKILGEETGPADAPSATGEQVAPATGEIQPASPSLD